MAVIVYDGRRIELGDGETVLDALLRTGFDPPHGCRSGICHTCKMKADEGIPPPDAQISLPDEQRKGGYFLPCVCRPEQDLSISRDAVSAARFPARVHHSTLLAPDVMELRLRCSQDFTYRAGQFITLHAGGIARTYSLCSVPGMDETLSLHIKRVPGGQMSDWVFQRARVGLDVGISAPSGDCCYDARDARRPLLLVGTGTGLAPLLGVVRDALRHGHSGPIHLYHGSRHIDGLYYDQSLRRLSQDHPNFHYIPCVSGEQGVRPEVRPQRALDAALSDQPELGRWNVFLCGNAQMVKEGKKRAFLAGCDRRAIYSDAFTGPGLAVSGG